MLPDEQSGVIYPLNPFGEPNGRRAGQIVRFPGVTNTWVVDIAIEEPMGPRQPPLNIKINVAGPGGGYRSIDFDDPRYAAVAEAAQAAFNNDNFLSPQEAQHIARLAGLEIRAPERGRTPS